LSDVSATASIPEKKLDEIRSGNMDFDWYYAKGAATISFENSSLTANADFRIKKDSAMLIVLRMMGLELGRALITRDSFFMVNRMEGNYMAEPIESIAKLYKVPFTFAELQQIIAGNHLTDGMKAQQLTERDGKTMLEASGERWNAAFIFKGETVESAQYTLNTGESVTAVFDDYIRVEKKKQSPLNRKYYYPAKAHFEYALELQLDQIELDKQKSMKFEIPSKYTRI
jgi:hypothetical protein